MYYEPLGLQMTCQILHLITQACQHSYRKQGPRRLEMKSLLKFALQVLRQRNKHTKYFIFKNIYLNAPSLNSSCKLKSKRGVSSNPLVSQTLRFIDYN